MRAKTTADSSAGNAPLSSEHVIPPAAGGEQSATFEQCLSELQHIVDELEDGTVGLDESMRRFERGMSLLRHCYSLLEAAEQRIEILTGRDAEGRAVSQPFDASATHETASPRAGRRARKPSPRQIRPADDRGGDSTDDGLETLF